MTFSTPDRSIDRFFSTASPKMYIVEVMINARLAGLEGLLRSKFFAERD